MSSSQFQERIVRAQNEILQEKDFIGTAHSRLSFTPEAYRRTSRVPLIAACVGVVAAAVTVFYLMTGVDRPKKSADQPHAITKPLFGGRPVSAGEWIFGAPDSDKTLRFRDGSDIQLSRKASVRIIRLQPNGAHLSLEHGGLSAHIIHRDGTSWTVDVGPFSIEVQGTQFNVNWSPETQAFRLNLNEGVVRVTGPMLKDGRVMNAEEKMLASLIEERIEIEDANHIKTIIFNGNESRISGEAVSSSVHGETLDTSGSGTSTVPSVSRKRPSQIATQWRTLAKAGKYVEAVESARQFGISRILKNESAETLMILGDTARRAGNTQVATQSYKVVRRRFVHTKHAAGAAFALGLIAFDNQKDFGKAAKWFDACARSSPPGSFTQEAAGRLMEALDRAGDPEGARRAARSYLSRYSNGPYARLAKKLITAK